MTIFQHSSYDDNNAGNDVNNEESSRWGNVDNRSSSTMMSAADIIPSHSTTTNHAHSNYSFASSSTYAVDEALFSRNDANLPTSSGSSYERRSPMMNDQAEDGSTQHEHDDFRLKEGSSSSAASASTTVTTSVTTTPRKVDYPRTLENLVESASGFHDSSHSSSSPCRTASPLSSNASSPVMLTNTPSVVFAPNSNSPARHTSSNLFADSDTGIMDR